MSDDVHEGIIDLSRLGIGPINVDELSKEEAREYLLMMEKLDRLEHQDICQNSFLDFVKVVYPGWITGRHHRIIAKQFERIARGEAKRLIINLPPRHSKSEMASFLFPAWILGRNPALKIIQATHTGELAIRFGRKVRDLLDTEEYHEVFPHTRLNPDSKSAGRTRLTSPPGIT